MVNQMNPFRHAVHPLAVDRQRLVFPRVEQAQRDIHEFFGAGIAPVVSRHGFVAMVARLGRRDHAGGVEGGEEGAGDGADQADAGRGPRDGRHGGQRFQIPARSIADVVHRLPVGEEDGVQLAALGGAGQGFVIADVAQAFGR
ncbi:hypothetical protein G6F22_015413 [Rhizopus arrhizus]|nr:hypothetical protein G6F22_015413 [Rhizopus arrhizus]